ncbi:MAG: hypothetical protein WC683_15775, partial [bacterium]
KVSGERKVEEWGRDNPIMAALNAVGRGAMVAGKPLAAFAGANIDAALSHLQGKPYDIRDFGKSFERVAGKSDEVAKDMERSSPWSAGIGAAIPSVAMGGLAQKGASAALSGLGGKAGWLAKSAGTGAATNVAMGQALEGGNAESIPLQAALGAILNPVAEGVSWTGGKIFDAAKSLKPVHKAKAAIDAIRQLLGGRSAAGKEETGALLKQALYENPEAVGAEHGKLFEKLFGGKSGKQTISQAPRSTINRISKDLTATGYLDDAGNVTGYADEYGLKGGPKLSKAAQDEAANILKELRTNPTRKGIYNLKQVLQEGGKFGKDVTQGSEAKYMRSLQRELNADIDAMLEREIGKDTRLAFQKSRKGLSQVLQKTDEAKAALGLGNKAGSEVDESYLTKKMLTTAKSKPSVAANVRKLVGEEGADSLKTQFLNDIFEDASVKGVGSEGYNISALVKRLKQGEAGMSPYLSEADKTLLGRVAGEAEKVAASGGKQLAPEVGILKEFINAEGIAKPTAKALWRAGGRPIARKGLQGAGGLADAIEALLRYGAGPSVALSD